MSRSASKISITVEECYMYAATTTGLPHTESVVVKVLSEELAQILVLQESSETLQRVLAKKFQKELSRLNMQHLKKHPPCVFRVRPGKLCMKTATNGIEARAPRCKQHKGMMNKELAQFSGIQFKQEAVTQCLTSLKTSTSSLPA